jgi:3-dehydroquinate synthase
MSVIKSTSYSVYIGDKSFDALNAFLKKSSYTNYFLICDEHTFEHCLPSLLFNCAILNEAEIIELESGEQNKNMETCMQVWGALTDAGADKKSLIINLGGGVISDLGGFVASTFKRGIDFINIPTTLLSMVDASIGGKTGVDFDGIKNHIGTTYEPKGVYVNPVFLESLAERHIRNGYAEVIKIALVADLDFWNDIKQSSTTPHFYSEELITHAIELKNAIVKKDLHEQDLRKSLNFGHSVGHALESALLKQNNDILHGEAVAFGIMIESMIAYQLKCITKKDMNEICRYIDAIYTKIKLSAETKKLLLEYIFHDKKNEDGNLNFALPNSIGSYSLQKGITEEQIKEAIAMY